MDAQVTPLFDYGPEIPQAMRKLIEETQRTVTWYRQNGFDGPRWAAYLSSLEMSVEILPRFKPGSIAMQNLVKVILDALKDLPEPVVEASDDDVEYEGDRVRAWLSAVTDLPDEADAE
jgi:hypothetical protein